MPATRIPGILPDDLWFEIFHHLEIVYIVRSARVCHYLADLLKLRPIWVNAISSQIYGQGLQLPGKDLDTPLADYETAVLRDMAIRAVKLTLNLARRAPQQTDEMDTQLRDKTHVTHVFLVSGSQGSDWLLISTGAKSISCWEVLRGPLSLLPASSWESSGAFIIETVRDTTPGTRCILAVTTKEHHTETYRTLIISVTNLEPGAIPQFHVLQTLENLSSCLIRGDYVVSWRTRRKIATVSNWKSGSREEYRLLPEDHPQAGFHTAEQCCALELTPTSLVIVTTSFRAAWEVSSSESSTLIAWGKLALMSDTRSASIVQLPLASPLLDHLPDKVLSMAIFLVLSRVKYGAGSELAVYELIVRRHDVKQEWKIFPLINERVPDRQLSPYVQGVVLSPAGRGILMDTLSRGQWQNSTSRLLAFDVVHRNPVLGTAPTISPAPFRTELIDSSETVLGQLTSEEKPMKTTCFDYDDAQGRIVVATSDGRLRIVEYS